MSLRLIDQMKGCLQCGTDFNDIPEYIEQDWVVKLFDPPSKSIIMVGLTTKFCSDECVEEFEKNHELQRGIEAELEDMIKEAHTQ